MPADTREWGKITKRGEKEGDGGMGEGQVGEEGGGRKREKRWERTGGEKGREGNTQISILLL